MNVYPKRVLLLAVLPVFLLIISCQKQIKGDIDNVVVPPVGAPSAVELRFKGIYDRLDNLTFDSSYHYFDNVNDFHTFSFMKFTALKYYISNFQFVNTDGDTLKIPDTYFLIDHSSPDLSRALCTVPAGSYLSMSFLLGVDSARSLFGPRTGALDPAMDMFWNPVDGYVNAMIEGAKGVTGTTLPAVNVFSLRAGGYRSPYSTLARRNFKLGGVVVVNTSRKTVINFTADAIQWFRGNLVPLDTTPVIDAPGAASQKLSTNYYKMFAFTSVQYE